MHSGATPLLRGCSRKNVFCQKIFDNFFSFQATEMVLTSKWGRIQPEIQIWPDQVMAASWMIVRSPKHAEKMLIQLRSPTAPSWPAVNCSTEQTLSVNRQAFKKSFRNLDIFFLIYQRTDHTLHAADGGLQCQQRRTVWTLPPVYEVRMLRHLTPATVIWGEDAPASDCYWRWRCTLHCYNYIRCAAAANCSAVIRDIMADPGYNLI